MISFIARTSIEFYPEGIEGKLTQPLTSRGTGRCKVHGVYWQAKLYGMNHPLSLPSGTPIQVLGRENICLLVRPLFDDEFCQSRLLNCKQKSS